MDNWILSEGNAHMTDGNIIQSIAQYGIQTDGVFILINLGKRYGGVVEKDCKCNFCTTTTAL